MDMNDDYYYADCRLEEMRDRRLDSEVEDLVCFFRRVSEAMKGWDREVYATEGQASMAAATGSTEEAGGD